MGKVSQWLVCKGLDKLVEILRVEFSNFRSFALQKQLFQLYISSFERSKKPMWQLKNVFHIQQTVRLLRFMNLNT